MGLFCKNLQDVAQKMIENRGSSQEEGKCRINIRMCPNSEPECDLLWSDLEERAMGLDVSAAGLLPPLQRIFSVKS